MDIPILADIAARTGGIVTAGQARLAGIPRQRLSELTRRGALARLSRGVYATGPTTAADPVAVTQGHSAVLSYESAAAWLGADLPKPVRRLHVTVPRNRGCRRDALKGVRLHRANLGRGEVVTVRGMPCTSPLRTALDVARHSALDEGVAIVDSLLRRGLLSLEEFTTAAQKQAGPGRARLQLIALLVDPASGSILESLTRVLLWRHQLMPARTQFNVRHANEWIGRVDFAWPQLRVLLECDGYQFHADRTTFQADRRRWSAFTRAGWRVAVVTWFDVTCDPDYVVALVRDLLGTDPDNQHTTVTGAPRPIAA